MFAHQRRGCLGAKERPGEIDRQHPAPVVLGSLQQRCEHRDPGVVDERIEPAESLAGPCYRVRHRARVGDVAMQRDRGIGFRQCRDRAVQQFGFDVEQRHAPALGEKPFCHRKPNAARGAGHQRDFLKGRAHG